MRMNITQVFDRLVNISASQCLVTFEHIESCFLNRVEALQLLRPAAFDTRQCPTGIAHSNKVERIRNTRRAVLTKLCWVSLGNVMQTTVGVELYLNLLKQILTRSIVQQRYRALTDGLGGQRRARIRRYWLLLAGRSHGRSLKSCAVTRRTGRNASRDWIGRRMPRQWWASNGSITSRLAWQTCCRMAYPATSSEAGAWRAVVPSSRAPLSPRLETPLASFGWPTRLKDC